MNKLKFLLFGFPDLFRRIGIWLGAIVAGLVALAYLISYYLLDKGADTAIQINLAPAALFIVLGAALLSAVAAIAQAFSKLAFAARFCEENGMTRDEFFALEARQNHQRWVDYLQLESLKA